LSTALAWGVEEFDADPELVDDESLPHATGTAAMVSAIIVAPARDALFNIGGPLKAILASSPGDLVDRVLRPASRLLPTADLAPVEGVGHR
jgi:hypothetical protein